MAEIRMRFGEAVRKLRLERKLSQEAFAAKAKINRSYMGQIERGEVNISNDNIQKIAVALGVGIGTLMSEVESPGHRNK